MLPTARLLAILAMITLACTGSAFAQDSSTSEALKALDKALEKPAPASEQSTAPAAKHADNGLLDLPINFGMTCEQAQVALGTFISGNCDDCKKSPKCMVHTRVFIDGLKFDCFFEFDNTNGLKELSAHRTFKDDQHVGGKDPATEWLDRYAAKVSTTYGKPTKTKHVNSERSFTWSTDNHTLHIFTEKGEKATIMLVKK